MEHKRHPTTYEVWKAIKAAHADDLQVFASFSNPDGQFMGFSGRGEMMTEYGIRGSDCAIMGARTTWEISYEGERGPEHHIYWLCLPIESDD